MKTTKRKKLSVRIPLPLKTGGAHSTKKGKRGYDRTRDKKLSERNWSRE